MSKPKEVFSYIFSLNFIFAVMFTSIASILVIQNESDTTGLTASVFGVLAILSNLMFNFSKSLKDTDEHSQLLANRAGELFLVSSVFIITFTFIKWSSFKILDFEIVKNNDIAKGIIKFIFFLIMAYLYYNTVIPANGGLEIAMNIFRKRETIHFKWWWKKNKSKNLSGKTVEKIPEETITKKPTSL